MIRKSNYLKTDYFQAIGEAIQIYQDSTAAFDLAAADVLGLNRTDMMCVGTIFKHGTISASQLASFTGLTRGAMTTALDRAEKAGFIKRIENPEDRRGVNLQMTKKGHEAVMRLWGHFMVEGNKVLARFDTKELAAILDFLKHATLLQDEHRERIKR